MPTKIYISGPITGTDDYVIRFSFAEKILKNKYPDCEIVNPVTLNKDLSPGTEWRVYMAECLRALCLCDAVYMLHRWSYSRGAMIEKKVAENIGLKVIYENDIAV